MEATYAASPRAIARRRGIITKFAFSMPFFTPRTTTERTARVKTTIATNGSHGAATNCEKNADGSEKTPARTRNAAFA